MYKFLGFLLLSFLSAVEAAPIQVSAASSLTEVLTEIGQKFKKDRSLSIALNFDASSRLARQISEGAPADLFFSADREWADYLQKKKLTKEVKDLLSNSLVVIAPTKSLLKLEKLSDLKLMDFKHLALAHETVPAGKYAQKALKKADAAKVIKEKIVSGDNVRQVLAWVAKGEADLGIVFKTDMLVENKVKSILVLSPDQHSRIVYSLVLLSSKPEAKAFFDYLSSGPCHKIFKDAGFMVIN